MTGRHLRRSSSLLKSSSSALVIQTAGAAVNLVMQSALARRLGAAAFGQYSLAFNLVQLVATPADLGASSSVTRLVPEYRVQQRTALLRGVVSTAQLVPLMVGTVLSAILAAVVIVLHPADRGVLLIAILSLPFYALSIVQMNVLRALGRIVAAFVPVLVVQPLLILLAVLFAPHRPTVLVWTWITVGALAETIVIQTMLLRRDMRQFAALRALALRPWLRISLPMLLISVLQLVFQRLDIVAVGLLLSAREAGIYVIANRLAVAAASLQKAMLSVVAPQMSSLHYSGQRDEIETMILRGVKLVFVPAFAITVGLAVAGGWILGLIGPQYRAGHLALVVYALGQLISVGAGPVGWLAAIIGQERAMARVSLNSAAVAVVGYAVLIPTIGIVGAAAANALGIAYRNVAANRLVRRSGYRISLVRAFRRRRVPA